MQITRRTVDGVVENTLPDGSRLLIDSSSETVIALNAPAGAAWDACSSPTTAAAVAVSMRQSLGSEVSDDLVQETLAQLAEKNLIAMDSPAQAGSSRRAFLTQFGAAAVPLVVAMTMGEQRAYAHTTGSGNVGDQSLILGRHHHEHRRCERDGLWFDRCGGDGFDW